MYELGLRNCEGQVTGCRFPAKGAVVSLEELDIPAVGGGGGSNHKVVHAREDNPSINNRIEWGDVDNEKQWGDGRALGGSDGNRGKGPGRALEEKVALSSREVAT